MEEFDQIITGNVSDLAEDITHLEEWTQTEIESLEQNVTDLQHGLVEISSSVEAHESRISSLEESIEAVDDFNGRIEENEIIPLF